jgi:hypothetical protein
MIADFTGHSSRRSSPLWLSLAALTVAGFLVVPFYLFAGFGLLLPATFEGPPTPWLWALFLVMVPLNLLYGHLAAYLLVNALVLILLAATLVWGRRAWVIHFLLALMLLAILAFPWLYQYRPAVVAAPGYAMRWPTQPGRLEGVARQARVLTEARDCEYVLLGWSAQGGLYYTETCRDRNPQVWTYQPDQAASPRPVSVAPADLSQATIPRGAILEGVRAPDVRPAHAEPDVRRLKVRQSGLASPDGRWVAVVVRHIYGPEDVILLSPSPEGG